MSENQKYSILSNELVRRLSNISPGVDITEKIVVLVTTQMKSSGYSRMEIVKAVCSGAKGFKGKVKRRDLEGIEGIGFYRTSKSTLKQRVKKKLTQKTSWYKARRKKEEKGAKWKGKR